MECERILSIYVCSGRDPDWRHRVPSLQKHFLWLGYLKNDLLLLAGNHGIAVAQGSSARPARYYAG